MKKIIITGNVGRDPELRNSQNGEPFTTFSVAVSVGTKQSPKTDWVDITCNGKLGEIAKNYIKQGSKLLVEGFPTPHAYIKDGKAIPSLRVYANNIEFISSAEKANTQHEAVENIDRVEHKPNDGPLTSDDIPF